MFSVSIRRIRGFSPLRGPNRSNVQRSSRCDGRLVGNGTSTPLAPSAAATEAVFVLTSVAAASGTLILGSLHYNQGGTGDKLASSRAPDAPTSSTENASMRPRPRAPPPSSRLLFVSLSIVSFLPYINFAAFACLAAIEGFKSRKEGQEDGDGKRKEPLSLLLSPAVLASFSIFYSLPFLLVALTSSAGAESQHSVFAMESLVLGISHFQAIRFAGEKREEAREREAAAAKVEAERATAGEEEEEEEEETSALFASLAASELERFDARLGLRTAKASRLKELAQAAGVLKKGRRARTKEEEGNEVASAPVAKTKASLAAALAAAATLEGNGGDGESGGSQSDLDFETRNWLTSELAREVEPLVNKKKRERRRGKGLAAAARALELLEQRGEGEEGET